MSRSLSRWPSPPAEARLPEAAGSSAMLCHTPSHSTSFVLVAVAACQAQPQTRRHDPTLPRTLRAGLRVRAHRCQIVVSPLSCRLTLNQDVQTELQMGKWCVGEGRGGRMCCRGWWPLSCRHTLLTKSDQPEPESRAAAAAAARDYTQIHLLLTVNSFSRSKNGSSVPAPG